MTNRELRLEAPRHPSVGPARRPVAQEVELQGQLLPRGVWRAPYVISGCPVLLAVTSRGELLAERIVAPSMHEQRVTDELEDMLDFADIPTARPSLAVVP